MFKHVENDCHLYVKPGEAIWSIQDNLNCGKIWLKGGRANQCCPAHPSSFLDEQGDANNWEIGVGEQKGVKGGVLIRCHSVHTQQTIKWLVDQGRERLISKEKVADLLCQEDGDGSFLLSLMDINTDVQHAVEARATWGRGPEEIEERAHKLSLEFAHWLIKRGMNGHLEGRELGSVEFSRWLQTVYRAIKWGDRIREGEALGNVVLDFESRKQAAYYGGGSLISMLDNDVQQEVATWNREATEKIAHNLGLEFVQWLIKQKINGHWEGKDVESIVWRENKELTSIFSQLDFETQKQAAMFNPEKTLEVAHLMVAEFVLWLIKQAQEGNWSKEEVGSVVFRRNSEDQLIIATLNEETQKQVAVFNKAKTCSAVPYMEDEGDFLPWLYEEAEKGEWDQKMVFEALVKEELDGKASFSPRIKPGISIVNCLSCPMISTYL